MLILLAESKTMSSLQNPIEKEEYFSHTPIFESMADQIMSNMASLPPEEIARNLNFSFQLAVKAHDLAYDFPHKLTGYRAINGFIGEAFRALDINSLDKSLIPSLDSQLRIISSIYGILKPSDIIKPYRYEFNKSLSPDSKTSIQIYKPKITIDLVKYIKDNKVKDIINLLPADADKCIDWKIVRAYTKVHKVCFQVMSSEGKLKTPITNRLKELRGLMCRSILENGIKSFEELTELESPHFIFSPVDSKPGLPVFISI